MVCMEKIDFVVTWLDSDDPEWIAQYNQYRPEKPISDRGRFREWGIFRYWFRAVEKYAPWVNKVFLVTNGKYPDWINEECPKLVLVKHSDYIDEKFLPTFNAATIELNMDKIEGLSETFVYFNDDTILNAPVTPDYYFRNGLPCDCNAETLLINPWWDPVEQYSIKINIFCDVAVLNHNFNRREVIRQNRKNWFGPHLWNGFFLFNMILHFLVYFQFFRWRHWEQPTLKSVIREIWEKEPDMMAKSCSRFRQDVGLTSYIIRYWQFASNRFHPVKWGGGKVFNINKNNIDDVCKALCNEKLKSVCLNDHPGLKEEDFPQVREAIHQVFERKFPQPSMFEKEGSTH